MENILGPVVKEEDQQLRLPPGFRFHPTDEELITHYLSKKVVDNNFFAIAIGEVDMNKVEPWDLPWKAKMGEKEWYFFCVRDKKYPTGLRTNRATATGYWKATGKDKEIFRGKSLVGMKKTLVFYRGRAPKGEKTNWVIHEYRLEGRLSLQNLPKTAKQNDWVISRVFYKSTGGNKVHISGLVRMNSTEIEMGNSVLPTLKDSESSHVHCFSNFVTAQKSQKEMTNYFNISTSIPSLPNKFALNQTLPPQGTLLNPGSFPIQDPPSLRNLYQNYGQNMVQNLKKEKEIVSLSQDTGVSTDVNNEFSSSAAVLGPQYLDYLWNY